MLKPSQSLLGCLSLVSFLATLPLPAAFATRPPTKAVFEDMAQRTQFPLQDIGLQKADITTWKDCEIVEPTVKPEKEVCRLVERQGWKLVAAGKEETWTYYLSNGQPQLDGLTSLSPKVRQAALQKARQEFSRAGAPVPRPQIVAATTPSLPISCPIDPAMTCPANQFTPGWRVLVGSGSRTAVYHFDLQGRELPPPDVKRFLPKDLNGLAPAAAEAVLLDLFKRLGTLPANTQVEPIWGGAMSCDPEKPTPACTAFGWAMTVKVGGDRWVYFIHPKAMPKPGQVLKPNGYFSLAGETIMQLQQAAAKQLGVPLTKLGLQSAYPMLSNACLNNSLRLPSCTSQILPGWQVTLRGQEPGSPIPNIVYDTTTSGSLVRLAGIRKP